MLELGEKQCDMWAYDVLRSLHLCSEETIHFLLCISRLQSFHSHGWTKKNTHNWSGARGVGPAGSFLQDGVEYKAYSSVTEGVLDFLKVFCTSHVKEATRLGSIKLACENTSLDINAIITTYNTLTANITWKKLLSHEINLWAIACEKYVNHSWRPSIEYLRATSWEEATQKFRDVYPNRMLVNIVGVSKVIGFKVEDKEGSILSV